MLSKDDLSETGVYPVFSSESTNNGIIGETNVNPEFIVDEKNPYFVTFGDHTRSFNVAKESFSVTDNVKVLLPIKNMSLSSILFIISAWKKCVISKGYARHWSIAKEVKFKLPCRNGKIDFDFMGKFIAKLEIQRIAELDAYLSVTGLKDTHLSFEEEQALQDYDNVNWGEFRMGTLFERISTKKLLFKADDLPKKITDKYTLPCLTSSFRNQGLNYFAPREDATILKNVVSLPSNSDVYRAYYQSNEFTVLSDAYAIRWIYDNEQLLPSQYLCTVACINKVTDLPVYSYKNKLGGWNVVQNKNIQLPIKNDKPDYNYMKVLISAIQKLVIRDVVAYADEKIAATKSIIEK